MKKGEAEHFIYSWVKTFLEFIPSELKNEYMTVELKEGWSLLEYCEITLKNEVKKPKQGMKNVLGTVKVRIYIPDDHIEDDYRVRVEVTSDKDDTTNNDDWAWSLRHTESWDFEEMTPLKNSKFSDFCCGTILKAIVVENPRAMSSILDIIAYHIDNYISDDIGIFYGLTNPLSEVKSASWSVFGSDTKKLKFSSTTKGFDGEMKTEVSILKNKVQPIVTIDSDKYEALKGLKDKDNHDLYKESIKADILKAKEKSDVGEERGYDRAIE